MDEPVMDGQDDPVLAKARKLRAAGVPLAEIERYVAAKRGAVPAPVSPRPANIAPVVRRESPATTALHREFRSGNLARRIATENQQDWDLVPNAGTEVLGALAATGRDIPGVEAMQAGASALTSGTSYRDALRNLRDATDEAALGTPARLAGSTLAMLALPGSAAQQGIVYGGAKGLLQADPDADLEKRGYSGAFEAALGGTVGKASEVGSNLVRGALSPTTDQLAVKSGEAIRAKTRPLYKMGEIEARGTQNIPQPIHPDVGKALSDPDIAPWVAEVRNSPAFAAGEFGPPDAITVLKQVYKNMGEAQRRGLTKVAGSDEFRPLTEQGVADLTVLKQKLAQAAEHDMPSWNQANRVFARGKGVQDELEGAAKVGRRIVSGRETPLTQLESSSPASFLRDIPKLSAQKADAAKAGVLSAVKGAQSFNPLRNVAQANRASPFLRALDAQSGTLTPELLQALGITTALQPTP